MGESFFVCTLFLFLCVCVCVRARVCVERENSSSRRRKNFFLISFIALLCFAFVKDLLCFALLLLRMCLLDVLKHEQIIISHHTTSSPQIMSIASSLVALKIWVIDDDNDHQNIYTKNPNLDKNSFLKK